MLKLPPPPLFSIKVAAAMWLLEPYLVEKALRKVEVCLVCGSCQYNVLGTKLLSTVETKVVAL